MTSDAGSLAPFNAPYAPDDRALAERLLEAARLSPAQDRNIDRTARRLIGAIRAHDDRLGGVEDMLREFALSTREGLALMVLAEALLRVPDARTADHFIEDRLGHGDFIHHETKSSAFLVNASAWALGMSARVIQPGETPQGTIGRLAKRIGVPAVRAATRQAMRLMGSHFVLGETIEAALARAHPDSARAPRYSFDMLGEGARTAADAARYFNSYASAIEAIGRAAHSRPLPDRPGNNRIDNLRNIVGDPRVSLLFLIPGVGETLRVNGRARISVDPDLLVQFEVNGKLPKTVIVVTVDAVYFHCAKSVVRSRLWDTASQIPRETLPSTGAMHKRLSGGHFDGETYDRDLQKNTLAGLY